MKPYHQTLLLIVSLALNVVLAVVLGMVITGNVPGTSGRLEDLRQKNADLNGQLEGYNQTIGDYIRQIEFYRNQVNGSSRASGYQGDGVFGTSGLQAPAVMSTVSYTREGSLIFERATQNGIMMDVNVEIKPGAGRVLVETRPLMGIVFQDAANTAVLVAGNITGANLSSSDVIFSIHAPGAVPQIDGPSAGALMTAVVTAAIENRTLNQSATLSGTINPDGTIGTIGGITDKAQAAKDSGKQLFLLPEGNQVLSFSTPPEKSFFGMATNKQITQTTDTQGFIENQTGIKVIFVRNISDVLDLLMN